MFYIGQHKDNQAQLAALNQLDGYPVNSGAWLRRFDDLPGVDKTDILR